MNKRIIYPADDEGVAIVIPTTECGLSIEDIANKDVPAGKPYKIVDILDIPDDRTFRNAWEADFTNPDGISIGKDEFNAKKKEAIEQ